LHLLHTHLPHHHTFTLWFLVLTRFSVYYGSVLQHGSLHYTTFRFYTRCGSHYCRTLHTTVGYLYIHWFCITHDVLAHIPRYLVPLLCSPLQPHTSAGEVRYRDTHWPDAQPHYTRFTVTLHAGLWTPTTVCGLTFFFFFFFFPGLAWDYGHGSLPRTLRLDGHFRCLWDAVHRTYYHYLHDCRTAFWFGHTYHTHTTFTADTQYRFGRSTYGLVAYIRLDHTPLPSPTYRLPVGSHAVPQPHFPLPAVPTPQLALLRRKKEKVALAMTLVIVSQLIEFFVQPIVLLLTLLLMCYCVVMHCCPMSFSTFLVGLYYVHACIGHVIMYCDVLLSIMCHDMASVSLLWRSLQHGKIDDNDMWWWYMWYCNCIALLFFFFFFMPSYFLMMMMMMY